MRLLLSCLLPSLFSPLTWPKLNRHFLYPAPLGLLGDISRGPWTRILRRGFYTVHPAQPSAETPGRGNWLTASLRATLWANNFVPSGGRKPSQEEAEVMRQAGSEHGLLLFISSLSLLESNLLSSLKKKTLSLKKFPGKTKAEQKMVAHTFNPTTWKQRRASLWVQDQSGLHCDFWDSQR